jgi:hypothetical protein
VEGSCEHGNEPLGSVKCWEILEWLSDWRLLKMDSAPWSLLLLRQDEVVWTGLIWLRIGTSGGLL